MDPEIYQVQKGKKIAYIPLKTGLSNLDPKRAKEQKSAMELETNHTPKNTIENSLINTCKKIRGSTTKDIRETQIIATLRR